MTELETAAKATGVPAVSAGSVREALQWAEKRGQSGAVVVCGSIYLVGEVRPILLNDGVI
jgi:folylpolyglutamate synthase/dihydropteroate synthase